MKTEFLKLDGLEDIPSMQQYLLEQSANKQWDCIKQGIEQYLGEPLTEINAPDVEIQYQGDLTRVLYKGKVIGNITGKWDNYFESNLVRYTWTWTPNKQ